MYKVKKKFVAFCCFLFLISCLRNGNLKVVKDYYSDGTLKSEQQYRNDTIKEGFYRRYYKNGKLEYESNYSDGKKNGISTSYYENGNVQSKQNNNMGLLDGETIWYYDNGIIECINSYSFGIKSGPSSYYYKNGKPHIYIYYDTCGNMKYRVDYGENGLIMKEVGIGFPIVIVNNDKIQKSDTFEIDMHLINPFHFKNSNLYINDTIFQDKITNTENKTLNENTYVYYKKWNTVGRKKVRALLKVESDDVKAKDTFQFNMIVKVLNK